MRSKFIVGIFILASMLVILPAANFAATGEKTSSVTTSEFSLQKRGKPGRWKRAQHWNRGKHRGWTRGVGNSRLVKQTYWRNGRRYVRYVRVWY